jgi:GT2 family glycosyltransferase
VDNGSSDGSAEFLAAQPDVQLIRNAENLGAPQARNQGIPLARGQWIGFLDNDVMVTPGWLGRMLWHGAVDPRVGCVCPMADRAAHGQQVPYEGGASPAEVAAFAARQALEHARRGLYKTIFPSFCVLVRRDVVERIGGFDARFSPWGFEDDDFSLRARLAGFRSRLALDVFVRHEAYGNDAAKADRHSRLLTRNWERFVEKWSRGAAPAYGEYAFLEPVFQRSWEPQDLFVPLPGGPAGPNPLRRD